jgi:hypothetical protein
MRLSRAARYVGMALVAASLSGCSHHRRPLRLAAPADVSGSWDNFFAYWVKPIVHVGTPALVVFVVLLTLARSLTRLMVTKGSPGPRGAKLWDRARISVAYWLGVIALLWAAIEATVIFPLGRKQPDVHWATTSWMTAVSIGVVAATSATVALLYAVVGRPPHSQVYAPGADRELRRRARIHGFAHVWVAGLIATPLVLVAIGLIVELYANRGVSFRWLNDHAAPLAYAPVLAGLGIVVIGRTRGIGIGMLIEGHDKAGSDDSGLGAFVRARLHDLGSHGPDGITVTQQTDVKSLPSEALSLIPEGTLAKLAQTLVQVFTPATPWHIDVTEQSDASIVVSIQRNGTVADATVIRPTTLGLPETRTADPPATDGPTTPPSDAADASAATSAAAATDWTVELRTAAAAFVLLTLSQRYEHLQKGLSGATDWRSVAQQVIATDPASRLGKQDSKELLARAVAADGGNVAADVALLYARFRDATSRPDTWRYIVKLDELIGRISNEEGMTPLRLRVRFNLMVALLNYATMCPLTSEGRADSPAEDTAAEGQASHALKRAVGEARRLIVYWSDDGNIKEYPELWRDMTDAITFAFEAIEAEWNRRFTDPLSPGWPGKRPPTTGRHMTLLARYERGCARIGRAAVADKSKQPGLYDDALEDLAMATSVQRWKLWARDDPSLQGVQDVTVVQAAYTAGSPAAAHAAGHFDAHAKVTAFKSLIGDPVPQNFLALEPLAKYRTQLEERGIHTASQLPRTGLATELSITHLVATRLSNLADLYAVLRRLPPAAGSTDPDGIGTGMMFLLLAVNIDSVEQLRSDLGSEANDEPLRVRLLATSRAWNIVAPTVADVAAWRDAVRPPG